MSTSSLKRESHKIKGEEVLSSGRIISMTCTCKAGLGEKCKHVLGTLLYRYRLVRILLIFLHLISYYVSDWLIRNFALIYKFGVNNLDELSCTDKPCPWKRAHSKSLEQYKPVSLKENESFKFKRNEMVKA